MLRRAIAAGFEDWSHAARDPDLRPLHGRPDFRALVLDRLFPADPFVRTTDRPETGPPGDEGVPGRSP